MASPDWQHEVLPPEYGADVSLAYLQHMSVCWTMDWELVKPISRVTLSKIGAHESFHRQSWEGCARIGSTLLTKHGGEDRMVGFTLVEFEKLLL